MRFGLGLFLEGVFLEGLKLLELYPGICHDNSSPCSKPVVIGVAGERVIGCIRI